MKWLQEQRKTTEFWETAKLLTIQLFPIMFISLFFMVAYFIRIQLVHITFMILSSVFCLGTYFVIQAIYFFNQKIEEIEKQAKTGDYN